MSACCGMDLYAGIVVRGCSGCVKFKLVLLSSFFFLARILQLSFEFVRGCLWLVVDVLVHATLSPITYTSVLS